MIIINTRLVIPNEAVTFVFSRSGGPGGQNVNKVNTKAAAILDIANCEAIPEDIRVRLMDKLATRLTKEGVLRIESSVHRTQSANREAAVEKLVAVLRTALMTKPRRHKTHIPLAVKEKRLSSKKRRGEIKRLRRDAGE